jgi:hypothetical protein
MKRTLSRTRRARCPPGAGRGRGLSACRGGGPRAWLGPRPARRQSTRRRATPTRRVKRARYWGLRNWVRSNFTPKRPPRVSRSGSSRPKPQLRRQHLVIDPGVPQEPVEPIPGTAPLNPQPGGATRPEPPRRWPQSPGRGSSAGSGERSLTNSSTWGIVPWGPWVSPPAGMGFQLPSEATCVPLAYPKSDKRSGGLG